MAEAIGFERLLQLTRKPRGKNGRHGTTVVSGAGCVSVGAANLGEESEELP